MQSIEIKTSGSRGGTAHMCSGQIHCTSSEWLSRTICAMENQQDCKHKINNKRDTTRRGTSRLDQNIFFRRDFAAQCGKWRKKGGRPIVIMDASEHTMDSKLRKLLEAEGVGLVEFSHKSWGDVPLQEVQ